MGNSSFPLPCFLELLSVPKLDDADFLPVLMHFRCPLEFVSIDPGKGKFARKEE